MSFRFETLAATPWLELRNAFHHNREGKEKAWTYATRPGSHGAVCVVATYTDEGIRRIVLVRQMRVPVGKAVIEFPAGLIDAGESLATTALRELREETGWLGEVMSVSPATYPSPGLTDEVIYFAEVALSHRGGTSHEEDEQIEVLDWPLAELRPRLEEAAAAGDGIDSKLWNHAIVQT